MMIYVDVQKESSLLTIIKLSSRRCKSECFDIIALLIIIR